MSSSNRPLYGSSFLNTRDHGGKPLEMQHLIISKEDIYDYLRYLESRYHLIQVKSDTLSNVVEQPSALGLMLIAHHYNNKGDQHTAIWIATCIADFQILLQKMASAASGTKAVLIFQPTDNIADEELHYRTHKAAFYLKKCDDGLHMVLADHITVDSIRSFHMKYAEQALAESTCQRHYHLLSSLKHQGKDVFLQTDNWSCGTYAFRTARTMAKHADFLASLKFFNHQTEGRKTTSQFKMPVAFARSADTPFPREASLCFFPEAEQAFLQKIYKRYPESYTYPNRFTSKYLCLLRQLVLQCKPDELGAMVVSADARHFEQAVVKPSLVKVAQL